MAEIGGATCFALRRGARADILPRHRAPLDRAARRDRRLLRRHALVGVRLTRAGRGARAARLHPRLRLDEVHARRRRPRGAQRPRRACESARSARTTSPRSSPAGSGCPTGRSRSRRTSSAGPAGRATSPTTATHRPARARCYVHEGVGWLGFGATLPELRGRGAQSATARRADRGRPAAGLLGRSPPRPASWRKTGPRTRTETSSGQASAKRERGQTTGRREGLLRLSWSSRLAAAHAVLVCAAAAPGCARRSRSARSCRSCSTRSLSDLTIGLMKRRGPRRRRPGHASPGRRGQTAIDPGLLSDLAYGVEQATAAGIDVYLDVYPERSSQTPHAARRPGRRSRPGLRRIVAAHARA